jgi:hypothetical protein
MNYTAAYHLIYLIISVAVTIWVARTLHKNGRIFLVDAFHGNEQLADSVNHLLVVGFYLVNIGFVTLAVKYGTRPEDLAGLLEAVCTKEGAVLLILGAMHFFNIYIFSTMRKRALLHGAPPPIPPTARVTVNA